MTRLTASPWHKLTVSYDGDELDYDVQHPDVCPPQVYEDRPRCWFDGVFFEVPDGSDEIPRAPGVYRARVWLENVAGQGQPADYTGGNEWELVGGGRP